MSSKIRQGGDKGDRDITRDVERGVMDSGSTRTRVPSESETRRQNAQSACGIGSETGDGH